MRRPARVDEGLTKRLHEMLVDLASTPPEGVTMYVVNQKNGKAYWSARVITVPTWAFTRPRGEGYALYYLAHELAHIAAPRREMHGPIFMEHFKRLCPEHLQHYELNYKPRNAAKAGIAAKVVS